MRQFAIILFAVLFALPSNAQTAPKPQDIAASQEQADGQTAAENPLANAPNVVNVGSNDSAQDQEKNAPDTDSSSSHRISILGLVVSDWIALGLGFAALVISVAGLRQNRISNERQNRAYLSVTKVNLKGPLITRGKFSVLVDFTNSGQTPAYRLSIGEQIGLAKVGPAKFSEESKNSMLTPAAQRTVEFESDFALTQYELDKVFNGTTVILLRIAIEYKDRFGNDWVYRVKIYYSPKNDRWHFREEMESEKKNDSPEKIWEFSNP